MSDPKILDQLDIDRDLISGTSYLTTQTLGGLAKEKGFSGIIFQSTKGRAKNVVIFNED